MANWATLKAAIAGVIKTNGNQEITGIVLQNTLNSIVNAVGENATFAGIAVPTTNPGTQDGPVFYIATTAGVYANFGGIELIEGEAIILQWNNGAWVKSTFKLMTDFNSVFDDDGKSLTDKLSELESDISIGQTQGTIIPYGKMENASPIGESISSANRNMFYYRVKKGDRIKVGHLLDVVVTAWMGVTSEIPNIGVAISQYYAFAFTKDGAYLKILTDGYFCLSPQVQYENDVVVSKYNLLDENVADNTKDISGIFLSIVDIPNLMAYAYNAQLNYDPAKGEYLNKCFRMRAGDKLSLSVNSSISSTVYCGFSTDVAYIGLAITGQESFDIANADKTFVAAKDSYLNISMVKDGWDKSTIKAEKSKIEEISTKIKEIGTKVEEISTNSLPKIEEISTKVEEIGTKIEEISTNSLPKIDNIVGLSPLGESIATASGRTMVVYEVKKGQRFKISVDVSISSLYVWTGITETSPQIGTNVSQYTAYDVALFSDNFYKANTDGYLCISIKDEYVDRLRVIEVSDVITEIKGVVPSTSEKSIVNATNYSKYINRVFSLSVGNISIKRSGNSDGYIFFGESAEEPFVGIPVINAYDISVNEFSDVVISGNGYLNISALEETWKILNVEYVETESNEKAKVAKSFSEYDARLNDKEQMLLPLCLAPISDVHDVNTLLLKQKGKQKLLLGLHKCVNNGEYNTENDAYLPNARNDFSDVRVYDDKGRTLPFSIVHKGNYELLSKKSMNGVLSPIHADNSGAWYCVNNGKISKSVDGGDSWQVLFSELGNGQSLCCITQQNTMLFGSGGIVYRSEYPYASYTKVLDENEYHEGSTILNPSIAQDAKGNLYLGHYQVARDIIIQKSVDDGKSWSICYRDDTGLYQHVHHITIDPVTDAVYVGCDGGGGVLKSTDEGVTWTDLRALHPDMPQATDNGMIYFGTGYKLMSGEASIVGGYSIIKTKDEAEYYPVLDGGCGTYYIVRTKNGNLYAGMVSSEWYRQASIFMSSDEGETWKQIYRTALHDDGSASDGFRETSIVEYNGIEYVVFAKQGVSFRTKILIEGGNNYSAQILVDIPEDSNKIYVADGYMLPFIKTAYNTEVSRTQYLYAPLNDMGDMTEYWLKGVKHIVRNNFSYAKNGRTLGNCRPIIQSPNDMYSVTLAKGESVGYYDINLRNGGFHIGCWISRNITQAPGGFVFLEKNGKKFGIWKENEKSQCLLGYDGTPVSKLTYGNWVGDELMRVDINVYTNGVVEVYVNGEINEKLNSIQQKWLSSFTRAIRLLYNETPYNVIVQHLEVTEYTVTAEQAANLYSGNVTDNL